MSRAGAVLALALVAAPSIAGGGVHQYVGAEKCKTCHQKELIGDQYRTWLEGPHHRAFETLGSPKSAEVAAAQGLSVPPTEAPACLRCHVTAYDAPPLDIAHRLDPADGVQCESCHGPGRDYRKKKIMSDVDRARAKGLWDAGGDAAICTACHNPESPTFDTARYTLPGGGTAGFDFEQAKKQIAHPIPPDVKGHFVELEKKRRGGASDEDEAD
jgi:hypothetical protein